MEPTVLIIHPERIVADLLVRVLNSLHVSSVAVSTPEEARAQWDLQHPKIALVDPRIENGPGLLEEMRIKEPTVEIIGLADSRDAVERTQSLGFQKVVVTGEGLDGLVDAIALSLAEHIAIPFEPDRTHVLVVDDEIDIVDLLTQFLRRRRYGVLAAQTGRRALEMVDRAPWIAVVLLDVILPEMGGVETLQQIMSRPAKPGVIMMSGIADGEIAGRALELGAFDYLLKPLDLERMEGAVIACLADMEYQKQPWWKRVLDSGS